MKMWVSLLILSLAFVIEMSLSMSKQTAQGLLVNGIHERSVEEFLNRKPTAGEDPPIAPINAYPHQVSLQIIDASDGEWFHLCGGSIVEDDIVLTSARCAYICTLTQCRMLAGAHDKSKPENTQQYRNVNQTILHPKFERRDYDYGLLYTDTKWEESCAVQSIPLSSKYPIGNCVASGYILGDKLRHLNMTILPYDECKRIYGNYFTNQMICASFPPLKDDEFEFGAPMECDGLLAGVSSWYDPPPGFPANSAVFSNIASERKWIQNPEGY